VPIKSVLFPFNEGGPNHGSVKNIWRPCA